MPTCPACAQMVAGDSKRCPACGNDLRVRRLATVRPDHDDELDVELLLSATIAHAGTGPPPPLVPSLDERMRIDLSTDSIRRSDRNDRTGGDHPWDGPLDALDVEVRDLLPAHTLVRRRHFLRRR